MVCIFSLFRLNWACAHKLVIVEAQAGFLLVFHKNNNKYISADKIWEIPKSIW